MDVVRGEYAPGLGFDLVKAPNPGAPLVVFLHGGGWMGGDRTMFAEEALWLAQQGYSGALVSYRFAPRHTFPTQVVDARRFVRFANDKASELGVDPSRAVAFGNSSGGHLALMLGLADERMPGDSEPIPKVAGVVSLAGISDLTDPEKSHYEIADQFVPPFMGGPYAGNEELYRQASPIHYLKEAKPPTSFLLIHGDQDDIVPPEQSRALARELRERDAEVEYLELPGEGHAYSLPGMQRIRQATLAFLQRLFGDV